VRSRRVALLIAASCLVMCSLFVGTALTNAQQTSAPVATSQTTYRAETGLVLVDAVVTDKKGNYIGDLTQKDFKVWEDGKEQSITSFSFEQSAASPGSGTPQYLVLFFDNSSMNVGDQAKARDAAAKFVDTNAGSSRLTAIVDFDGTVHISQNFTANAARLEQALKGLKGSSVSPNGQPPVNGAPFPTLSQAEADFGVHTVLLAVRSLAQSLSVVPGRKTLVMLTSGFPLDFETQSEVAAVVAACNKSNVAIYPIDVRGLTVPDLPLRHGRLGRPLNDAGSGRLLSAALQYRPSDAAKVHLQSASFTEPHPFLFLQHPGTGGSGGHPSGPPASSGGGAHGVPPVGSRPATGGYNTNVYSPPPVQPRIIVPDFPSDASQNQQVLYQLAEGTGGFVNR
jgi:VWFA-related protein